MNTIIIVTLMFYFFKNYILHILYHNKNEIFATVYGKITCLKTENKGIYIFVLSRHHLALSCLLLIEISYTPFEKTEKKKKSFQKDL